MKASAQKFSQNEAHPIQDKPKGWWRRLIPSLAPKAAPPKPTKKKSISQPLPKTGWKPKIAPLRKTKLNRFTQHQRTIILRARALNINVEEYCRRFGARF